MLCACGAILGFMFCRDGLCGVEIFVSVIGVFTCGSGWGLDGCMVVSYAAGGQMHCCCLVGLVCFGVGWRGVSVLSLGRLFFVRIYVVVFFDFYFVQGVSFHVFGF